MASPPFAPEPRELLPPLLACLATSTVSPQPPPALLPLLAPILRQRVNFLSQSRTDGWLPLLSWDVGRGAKLPQAVGQINLEPHPVSGELELEDVSAVMYRRLDQETLQVRLEVEQFGLLPIYVWCENDEHASSGAGWRLTELRTLSDVNDGTDWFDTAAEANEAAGTGYNAPTTVGANTAEGVNGSDVDDSNDDYWAAYDRTPGETPARTPAKRSPAPFTSGRLHQLADREEDEYYARYGEEVQPAMDSHDPDEDTGEVGQSSLNGHTLASVTAPARADSAEYRTSLQPHDAWGAKDSAIASANERSPEQKTHEQLSMPRPISPASSHSSIDRLEEKAAEMSTANDHAQLAVKQHISTDIKSLFRLAKASGMDREEFVNVVQRELDVLGLLERDE
ncbi:hypothetical protein CB0940_01016 [Cercospora beticola]|uniref:Uncharacterized protein n=1 Tax=Cercospora beticola TaxID=122368 RepID=A0A2G5I8R6_CERBT|nr:hypothetical protein CB0940_01016 [Cercospora beticola]PIB00894.1 hypothetical protein CB0940_01016 [Cercospora beticola]WPA96440.1 hypothetical protein RHO25_001047 [Cercospora beticola]CAK1355236.1 unnamed protein product [Cercospora beticola]